MVVFSVAGVEAFRIAYPTSELMGVPLVEVLNPYRAVLAVLYPQTMQLTGVVRTSSLVYIGCRLTFAATAGRLLHLEAAEMEPGRQRAARAPGRRRGRGSRNAHRGQRRAGLGRSRGRIVPDRRGRKDGFDRGWLDGRDGSAARWASPSPRTSASGSPAATGPANGEPGPTTGLHVPRRTHRRKSVAARPYRHPWANPILWRELMTRAYGARPLIIKGCYVLLLGSGWRSSFNLGQELENPLRSTLGLIPIGLAILSLVLVNAQGVTALTTERDTGASTCCWFPN